MKTSIVLTRDEAADFISKTINKDLTNFYPAGDHLGDLSVTVSADQVSGYQPLGACSRISLIKLVRELGCRIGSGRLKMEFNTYPYNAGQIGLREAKDFVEEYLRLNP